MQTRWVRFTKAKSYDRGVRSHLIDQWVLRVILFLSVIVGKRIVEELELRNAKGVIKMWQGSALVDELFGGIGSVDWNHADSQGKGDTLGI
jgi:hypothetical protein